MKTLHYTEMDPMPVTVDNVEGVTIRWLIAQKDGAPNFAMRLFEVAPGGGTPLHTHDWEHEVFILKGQGVVWKAGEEVPVTEGTAIYVEPKEEHCFKNNGDSVFQFLCMVPVSAQG